MSALRIRLRVRRVGYHESELYDVMAAVAPGARPHLLKELALRAIRTATVDDLVGMLCTPADTGQDAEGAHRVVAALRPSREDPAISSGRPLSRPAPTPTIHAEPARAPARADANPGPGIAGLDDFEG